MLYFKKVKYLAVLLVMLCSTVLLGQDKNTLSLEGNWQFSLDSMKIGEDQKWFNKNLPNQIKLPGSTDEGGYGTPHIKGAKFKDGKDETYRLARKVEYIGPAWYRKEIFIPADWKDKRVYLNLERVMWQTKVWINDTYIGEENSLCASHKYELTNFLKPGKNDISIRIDNSPQVNLGSWSHGYSPEIQTIWNGVIGKLELTAVPDAHVKDIQLYPSYENQELKVKLKIDYTKQGKLSGIFNFKINNGNAQLIDFKEKIKDVKNGDVVEVTIPLDSKLAPWSDSNPNLYTLELVSTLGKKAEETNKIRFGLRDFKNVNGRFMLNGTKLFLRGEHDAGSFPQTGYPSMDKDEWIRIFKIGKEYGFNHWRFHSWCPPDAAFSAADEIGVILQIELSLFSQVWEKTLVGNGDAALDKFLETELIKLLDTYGNHPSFAMMCMGNELKGDSKFLEKLVALAKQHDSRHLYAGSANLEAMRLYNPLKGDDFMVAHSGMVDGKHVSRRIGNFNTEKPNTAVDYSNTLLPPYGDVPILSHETGQWAVYPDFREIPKFKGVLSPRGFEVFKESLISRGMGNQALDFVQASGKLSTLLYREEIERLLRTPKIGGFQILDLHDYPGQGSALVGILNQFWESKGLITPDEFRQSNNELTLLLKMSKRTWQNNETFTANLVVPNYKAAPINGFPVKWKILDNDKVLKEGILSKDVVEQGEVNSLGQISFDLSAVDKATKLLITLENTALNVKNIYDLWVYPANKETLLPKNIILATEIDANLKEKIQKGATVLLVTDKIPDTERMTFTTPFWSTIMFSYQVKTMGILTNPQHAVFNDFPTDFYTNWQWWELVKDARTLRLNATKEEYRPIVQVIDHVVRNDKLGAIMETKIGKGRLLFTTLDILSDPENRIVARQLKSSIISYMSSPAFNPVENKELITIIFPQEKFANKSILSVKSSDENPEYPAANAFDGNIKTVWKINGGDDVVTRTVVEFNAARFVQGCSIDLERNGTEDATVNVYIADNLDNKGNVIIAGNVKQKEILEAKSWDNGFTIQKGKKGKYAIIEIHSKKSNQPISIREIKWVFGD